MRCSECKKDTFKRCINSSHKPSECIREIKIKLSTLTTEISRVNKDIRDLNVARNRDQTYSRMPSSYHGHYLQQATQEIRERDRQIQERQNRQQTLTFNFSS